MNNRRNMLIIAATLFLPLIAVAAGYFVFSRLIGLDALQETPVTEVARDDFEEFQVVWQLGHGWEHGAVGTNSPTGALIASGEPEPTRFGDAVYGDVVVSVRFWVDEGEARLNVRDSAAGQYSIGVGPTGRVRLYRNGEMLAEDYADAVLSGPPWHALRFSAIEDRLLLDVDGKEMFVLADQSEGGALPPGQITFSAGEVPSRFYVDDFVVAVPAAPAEE